MGAAGWFHTETTERQSTVLAGDLGLLGAWWLVVALGIAGFDLIAARASFVSLAEIAGEHAWPAALATGFIGACYAERNHVLCALLSALGGLLTFAATVTVLVLLGSLVTA